MTHVRQQVTDGRDELFLSDATSGSSLTIVPGRGALVTRFHAHGREILFLDEGTLRDQTKNVRGGIPVLFPTPGKLEDDTLRVGGATYHMKQHGFARDLPWRVEHIEESKKAAVRLVLDGMDLTGKYPFTPALSFTFTLAGTTLVIEQHVENRGREPMPFGMGFHPYFYVPDAEKGEVEIETHATRAFDNRTKREVAFDGFDLTEEEVDLHLLDHGATHAAITRPGGERVEIRGSSEFTHWVVWTLRGRDFVCVEPWTAPGNALNTGEHVLTLAPGESRDLWLEIAAR